MKNITYVDYKFQTTKHNRIIFDKELLNSTVYEFFIFNGNLLMSSIK